jgi:hypothetical protein
MDRDDFPAPSEGFVLTHFLVVADQEQAHEDWRAAGAEFLTEPKDHTGEIRAYMREPDDHLIEVGQSKWRPE